jgi:hypothetical protein
VKGEPNAPDPRLEFQNFFEIFSGLNAVCEQIHTFHGRAAHECSYGVEVCIEEWLPAMEMDDDILWVYQMGITKLDVLWDSKALLMRVITYKALFMKAVIATKVAVKKDWVCYHVPSHY